VARTILPSFLRFPNEGILIGRLLAGYTDLEISLMNAVQIVRDDFDAVLKTMFRVRGETMRVNLADALGRNYYKQHQLDEPFARAVSVMRHCVTIRNQYAHCVWWDDNTGKLAFANLEEVANIDGVVVDLKHLTAYHVDVPLLESQEAYYVYADSLTTWVNYEGRFRAGKLSTQLRAEPPQIAEPPLRLP
jgi:hypothetical protein